MFIRSGYSAQTRSVLGASPPRSRTKHHHVALQILVGGLDAARGSGVPTRRDPLALELLDAHEVELDHVPLAAGRSRVGPQAEQSGGALGRRFAAAGQDSSCPFDRDASVARM